MHIQIMNEADCMTFIRGERTGRLACCNKDRPYVVPVHYVCSGNSIYSFSMPGQKLVFMRLNPNVCLEVENIQGSDKWRCAVIEGIFQEFTAPEDKQDAWNILREYNDWWEIGGQFVEHAGHEEHSKPAFFSVSMDVVSGRTAVPR